VLLLKNPNSTSKRYKLLNPNTQQTEKNLAEQLAAAQAEIAEYQKEIAQLRQALADRTQDIPRLLQWIQGLHQDITAIYESITWKSGNLITQLILKILLRPVGPTARDHINKIITRFEWWKNRYFQMAQQYDLPPLPYTPWHDTAEYAEWIKQYDTLSQQSVAQMRTTLEQWQYRPMISILMPIADANEARSAIESVQKQIYPYFELLLINQDVAGNLAKAERLSKRLDDPSSTIDERIKRIDAPQSLAAALNHALATAGGDFIALMGAEDQLPIHALYQIAETINAHPNTDLIYTDEDRLDANGQRIDPYFKSDWNPDLFYSQNFIRHLAVYRRRVVDNIGGFCSDYPGNEDYDFALRFIEQIDEARIHHIPKILYHQSTGSVPIPSLSLNSHININSTSCQALQAHFERLGQSVKVVDAIGGHTRVIYPLPNKPPLVSLIIPTRDKLELLRGTVDGLLNKTDYQNIEIIIMDNGSVELDTLDYLTKIQQNRKISVIRDAAPFNYSRLNNLGVSRANGDIIGLINNDLEVISAEWLTEMVSHALRPKIGAVGAKLYYTNNTLQHAGVIVGLGGMAGHGFKFLAREAPGYYWRPFLIQNYSAVTAACLIMRRKVFEEVGWLAEKHLKVAFNDVDLCLRIREHGYRIVWTPYAELYHLESASRGVDDTPAKFLRLQQELKYMNSRWGETLLNDPYYNPNLTLEYEDLSLAWPPGSMEK